MLTVVVKAFHNEADPAVIDRPLQRRQSPELQVGLLDLLKEREQHINAEFSKKLLEDMVNYLSTHMSVQYIDVRAEGFA